jgi:hypothetical protein
MEKKNIVVNAVCGVVLVFGVSVAALVGYTVVQAFCHACVWGHKFCA